MSAASALTPHFPEVWPRDGLGVGWGWSWAKLGGLGSRSLLQNTSQHREGADKETIQIPVFFQRDTYLLSLKLYLFSQKSRGACARRG